MPLYNLGGGGWTQIGSYDHSVDGTVANVDFTGLTGSEFLVLGSGITLSTSADIYLRASVDNGSTFYSTSGDYKAITSGGTETNSSTFAFLGLATTAARSIAFHVFGNSFGYPFGESLVSAFSTASPRRFAASASTIDALRVIPAAGNINGGTLVVLERS